ncbi:restriction endonuclease subunit S [uncultured Campylobacter sp.]|uniref:restriction endonuclease subunit S n=1 Tax=uncultured Campylobacter sp. TaxID=218934 RepID=UPI0026170ACE|nr:restriction endonuclease subunit S [uncultured Campylobacter sp.]
MSRIPFENSKFEKVRIRFLISEKTKSKIKVGDAKPKYEAKYPFFTSGENILSFDEFLCDNQTIFLNTGGNASVKFYDGKASYSTDTYAIKSKNENFYLTKFLFYCLNDTKFMNDIYFEGSALKHLQKNKFKNFKIPLPPLNEQKKIAEFLDKKCEIIDKRLNNLERKIKSLKEYKKSLISECVTKGLNPKNREFKDSQISWIGQIPTHWEISKIKYIVSKKITDGTHQTPEYADENTGSPFLSAKDVTSGYINWENIKYITKSLHNQLQKEVKPQKDDILLAKNGTTGIAALVTDDKIFDIYVTLALIRANKNIVLPKFLLYIINSELCKIQFNLSLIGIGVQNLHLNLINNTLILVPPLNEQKEIAEFLDKKCEKIDRLNENYTKQITTLKEYKKSLIYECVTGKKEI